MFPNFSVPQFVTQSLIVAAIAFSSTAAWGQSTDPENPTPWTGYGMNHRGNGRDTTYYYSLPGHPGTLTSHVRAQASHPAGTSLRVAIQDRSSGGLLSQMECRAGAERASENQSSMNLSRRQPLLMSVFVAANTGEYSLWIDQPRAQPVRLPGVDERVNPDALQAAARGDYSRSVPSSDWEMSGSTSGDFYYPVVLNPGDYTMEVTTSSREFSTATSLDLEDAAGVSQQRVAAIATTTPVTERIRFRITARQSLRLHVRVEANNAGYRWRLSGPSEH